MSYLLVYTGLQIGNFLSFYYGGVSDETFLANAVFTATALLTHWVARKIFP